MRGVLLVALLVIGASGCLKVPAEPFVVPEDGGYLILNLEADNSLAWTVDPAQDTGSGDRVAMTTGNGALQRYAGYAQGTVASQGAVFTLAGGLPSPAWLNVTAAVRGTIFVANTLGDASDTLSPDDLRIRTELWVDGEFGGAREYDYTLATSAQTSAWMPVPVWFRPEVRELPAGAPVEVRVVALFGTNDLLVGTGGDHQSFLALHVFPSDPLGGTLYLEDGVLVTAPTQPNATAPPPTAALAPVAAGLETAAGPGHLGDPVDAETWAGPLPPTGDASETQAAAGQPHVDASDDRKQGVAPVALLGMALLGLFGLAWRGPRRPTLAVLVVAAIVLAGCGKPAAANEPLEQPEPTIQPKVDEKLEDYGDDPEPELGAINGTVADHLGLRIAGAHLSLIGTNRFTSTDEAGRFEVLDLQPGTFSLRVTAPEKAALERSVEVVAGKVNVLQIQLAPEDGRLADDIVHDHDEWRGATRKLLGEATLEPRSQGYFLLEPAASLGPGMCASAFGDSVGGDDGIAESEGATAEASRECDFPVDMDIGSRILPGTVTVEVVLDWDTSGARTAQRLGVMYANAKQDEFALQENRYAPRAPGVPTMIQIMPDEADPGHQAFTNWRFWVEVPVGDLSSTQPTMQRLPTVSIEVYGHKGIVPYEPAHRDLWDGRDEITLFEETTISHSSSSGQLPSETHYFQPEGLLPVGTQRIEGTLSWHGSTIDGPPPAITYGLSYKPANVASANWEQGLKPVEGTISGSTLTFTLEVTDQNEMDQYYQTTSNFRFYVTATGDDLTAYRGTVQFTLDATAYR